MRTAKAILGVLALVLFTGRAHAAAVTGVYTKLGGSNWLGTFSLANTGDQPGITGFTVYFPQDNFSSLTLRSSPRSWDAIVVEPDVSLRSPGFIDAFVLDSARALTNGQYQDGFAVQFSYLGHGVPGALPFDIVDYDYNVLSSGTTVMAVVMVPEPSSAVLLCIGGALIGFAIMRRRRSLADRYCLKGSKA